MLDTPEFKQFLLREGIGIMLSNGVDLENNAGIAHLPGLIKGVNRGVLLFLEAIYPQIGE